MRAREFIAEDNSSTYPNHKNTLPGVRAFPDMNQYYDLYRFGIAMAGQPDTDPEGEVRGPVDDSPITISYTKEEDEIVAKAAARLGKESRQVTSQGSFEADDVNKTSPTAKPKRNQYGV